VKKILIYLAVLVYAYVVWSCANPTALTGGSKDTTPPRIVKDGVLPKNGKTNFVKQDIYFTFDEWVKLNDVVNEVVISPPLEKSPEIKLKNKEVVFSFGEDEVLKEDVTYTINFGEAIKDLTENNPAKLKYVFSTGDFIDSLDVSGSVKDAITKEPVKDCLVMMYVNLSDTIVRTEKPYYFVKTDDNGLFDIGNVKEGMYQIFALHEDQGQRYIFDTDTEGIGFLDAPIVVNDTLGSGIALEVFKEEEELRLKDEKLVQYGHAWFAFNREPFELDISHEDKGQDLRYDYRQDSVHIWFDTEEPFYVYLGNDTLWRDTVEIKAKSKAEFLEEATLTLRKAHAGAKKVNRKEGIKLQFNTPLAAINNGLVGVYADTTLTLIPAKLERDTGLFGINVIAEWKQNTPYELVLLPGAVEDIYGVGNDTINLEYITRSDEDFGEIEATIMDLDSTMNYVVTIKGKSNQEIKRYIITGQSDFSFDLGYMEPGDYTAEVVLDRNKNGRWDTGSYDEGTYPEQIYTQRLETLRANWTVEVALTPTFVEKK
jgi:hypothetical protein